MIKPTYISERDLAVRIQTIQCCLANKADKIASDLAKGIDCECKLKQLELAEILLDSIKCYNTSLINTTGFSGGTVYEFSDTGIYTGSYLTVVITVDGDEIFNFDQNPQAINLETVFENLVLDNPDLYWYYTKNGTDDFTFIIFNTTPQTVEFVLDGVTHVPDVVNPYPAVTATYYDDQNAANCLTVEQLDKILQYLANYCGDCFLEYGQYDNL